MTVRRCAASSPPIDVAVGKVGRLHARRAAMIKAVGAASVEDLFEDIPPSIRNPRLDLPPPLSELEACALAMRQTRRRHILFDRSVNPHYRELLTSYAHNVRAEITELDYAGAAGDAPGRVSERVDESAVRSILRT